MNDTKSCFILVAVALPLHSLYHYALPESLIASVDVGHGVIVPFGPRTVSAFVLEVDVQPAIDVERVKFVKGLLRPDPLFSCTDLEFFKWISDYYVHPLGEVIRSALPPGLLVSSRLTCRLTASGRACLEGGGLDADRRRILERVGDRGISWRMLERRPPVEGFHRLMRELQEAGHIRVEQVVRGGGRSRRETWIRKAAAVDGPPRGPVQRRIWEALGPAPLSLSALKEKLASGEEAVSGVRAAVNRLVKQGFVEYTEAPRVRGGEPEGLTVEPEGPALSAEQEAAVDAIVSSLDMERPGVHLLFGVTGSGKTEVYLRAVAACLERGRDAVVLVPEIALTPQLVGRFQARLGDRVLAMHSAMPQGERLAVWMRLKTGGPYVLIGPRSTLFAPMRDPGLFIVDEEHDASLKQESGLRYNARDMAVVRGRIERAPVVLGSATPSLETFTNAVRGRYHILRLRERITQAALPPVTMLDMTRAESRPLQEGSSFSPLLLEALSSTLERGDQAILLLNRRGYAPYVVCLSCGGSFRCTNCDVSLTWHRRRTRLLCHYCGLSMRLPRTCPHCRRPDLELMGEGTERLEHWLEHRFPGVALGRLDRDSVNAMGPAAILDAFRRRETQILLGTQMVVKGHDFPGVTLVGILNADQSLHLPDFRASERTFQLLTQVAGRAGRGGRGGDVYIQTCFPRHPALQFAAEHDFQGFYDHEMKVRRMHRYPPFSRLALVSVNGGDSAEVEVRAREVRALLDRLADRFSTARPEILGPAPAPLGRISRRFRWQVLVKSANSRALHHLLRRFREEKGMDASEGNIRLAIDVDPQSLL